MEPGTVEGETDPANPCWHVFAEPGTAVYTLHHHNELSAKAFACMVGENNGWPIVYVQPVQGECRHDTADHAPTIMLRDATRSH